MTISYALTMIPDWKACVANAIRLLKPGGQLCVCDFTVHKSQFSLSQWFWKSLFAQDHVFLRHEHLAYLRDQLDEEEGRTVLGYGGFPYVPVLRSGYYVFFGRK